MVEKYLKIDPSGELSWIELERCPRYDEIYQGAESISLADLYPIIGCSCCEQVYSVIPGIVFMVDESGKIKDPMQPYNRLGSRLYDGSAFGDYIHGSIVLFSMQRTEPYGEYDLFPLSASDEAKLSLFLGVSLPEK